MDKIFGVVRHVIGLAGGVLIGLGLMDAEQSAALATNVEAISGGILAVVAIGASVIAKLKDFKLFGKKDAE